MKHLDTIEAALKFYAKHCPQNSLDGPEGMPTAFKAKEALRLIAEMKADYLLVRRDKEETAVIDKWLLYDGNKDELLEFIGNIEWDYFMKGGRDKKGLNVMFLRKDNISVAAIRASDKRGNWNDVITISRNYIQAAESEQKGEKL